MIYLFFFDFVDIMWYNLCPRCYMNIDLLILKNRAKLEKLIEQKSDYNFILKQSQKLDKLILEKMRQ